MPRDDVRPVFQRIGTRLVFAHRGGSALSPENTIPAFERGLDEGADGLELDVHLSRDGVVMVHHDATLDRTTNATGPLNDRTADELARVDAAHAFGADRGFPMRGRGIGVPRLVEVLQRWRNIRVIIELKVNAPALARAVVDLVRAEDAVERVCLGSFGVRVLRAARDYEPHIATSAGREEVRWALYRSKWRIPIRSASYNAFQVPETAGSTRVVSERFVRDAHAIGAPVQVWTVDDAADMRRLLAMGCDAIISDRPDVAVQVVRAWNAPGART